MRPNRERLLLLGGGLVAGLWLAVFFEVGSRERPDTTRASAESTPRLDEPGAASRSDERCDLGVVVARRAVDLVAETDGAIETFAVDIGDSIDAGAVVARLDVRLLEQDLAAEQAALAAAHAEAGRRRISVQRARAESDRRQSLAEVVSQEEIARAAAELEEEQALVRVAEAEIQRLAARIERLDTILDRATVRAPFAGRIASRYLDPGSRAAVGTPIVRLISDQEPRIRFATSPERAAGLAAGSPMRVEVPARGVRLAATIEHVAPEIDAASRLVFVEASLAPDAARDRLRTGEVVRVAEPESAGCREPAP